jgi:hypothetical protein
MVIPSLVNNGRLLVNNLSIITAFNRPFGKIAALCFSSMAMYRSKVDPTVSVDFNVIPESFERPCSWFKIKAIKNRMISISGTILWIDSDTIITGGQNIDSLIDHDSDLTISVDENGINCGVMAWRTSDKTIGFMDRVWDRTEFIDHPWWEQAAIADMIDELSVSYVDKSLFNAYPSDATDESGIIHWPGMSIKERESLMLEVFNKHWT